MHTLLPYSDDPVALQEGEALEKELIRRGLRHQLSPWGTLWVRNGKVICTMPSHPIDEFADPPLLFIDESSDIKHKLFFVGALVFRSLHAIIAVARHIQNLVVLAQAHKEFWPSNAPPPRLHLRELSHPAARLKTRWKHVPWGHIEALFRTLIPSVRELAGLKLIAPIERVRLQKVIADSFPEQAQTQLQQVSIHLASLMLRILLSDAHLAIDRLEIVADHDHTPIRLGTRGRQATLHFLDGLTGAKAAVPIKAELIWNRQARYSSKFPSTFSLETLETTGFPLRTLVESVGLQFADVYLGLWRIINTDKRSHLGISSNDLGVQLISNVTWADDLGISHP